jgi:hypothetical protein
MYVNLPASDVWETPPPKKSEQKANKDQVLEVKEAYKCQGADWSVFQDDSSGNQTRMNDEDKVQKVWSSAIQKIQKVEHFVSRNF